VVNAGTHRPSCIIFGRHAALLPSPPSSCGGHSRIDEERSCPSHRHTQLPLHGILRVPPFPTGKSVNSRQISLAVALVPSRSPVSILLLVLPLPLILRAIRLIILPQENSVGIVLSSALFRIEYLSSFCCDEHRPIPFLPTSPFHSSPCLLPPSITLLASPCPSPL